MTPSGSALAGRQGRRTSYGQPLLPDPVAHFVEIRPRWHLQNAGNGRLRGFDVSRILHPSVVAGSSRQRRECPDSCRQLAVRPREQRGDEGFRAPDLRYFTLA